MEPAAIDWRNVESRFVRDDLYEHFNAPKWLDLSSSPNAAGNNNDDDTWFCRPDCRHPKNVEDFLLRSSITPPNTKARSSNAEVLLPLGERISSSCNNNQRDGNLKRRGVLLPPSSSSFSSPIHCNSKPKPATMKKKFREDLENQNPNLASPAPTRPIFNAAKVAKETVKSSTEKPKREVEEAEEIDPLPQQQRRRLKSTLSARNLFAGKDILSQISEFCSEIKKLAMIRREKEEFSADGGNRKNAEALVEKETEPSKENNRKNHGKELDTATTPTHVRKTNEPENIGESAGLKKTGVAESLRLLQQEVRSCPPTPQRFPSPLGCHKQSKTKASPLKPFKPRAPERGILRELVQNTDETNAPVVPNDEGCNIAISGSSEAKSLDMFWFFKPCTYLGRR